jgi:hypothetical protein
MASVIREVDGKLSNLRVLQDAPPVPFLGSPFMQNPTKRNFEPRLGVAWDPFKDGKTSLRAGAGIFDLLPLRVEMAPGVDGVYPFQHTLTNVGNLSPVISYSVLLPRRELSLIPLLPGLEFFTFSNSIRSGIMSRSGTSTSSANSRPIPPP